MGDYLVSKVTLVIVGILIIGVVAAGGVTSGIKLFDKIKFEAQKIRGKTTERS